MTYNEYTESRKNLITEAKQSNSKVYGSESNWSGSKCKLYY